jgi:hypothetical protein
VSEDRKLLELAAKAAGMNVLPQDEQWPRDAVGWFFTARQGDNTLYSNERPATWNPLTEDGDALRLAVKLRLHVDHATQDVAVWVIDGTGARDFEERNDSDPYAATRRAIVRAAAAIGEAK